MRLRSLDNFFEGFFIYSLRLSSIILDDEDSSDADYDNFIYNMFEEMGYSEIPINTKWKDISDSKKRGIIKLWDWVNSRIV